MDLHGLHHVTAVTGDVKSNLDFYTGVLGLRLVKKTVNQDDVSAYHLFYADKLASPGFDMTFFDWPQTGPNRRGTDSIANTMFRVSGRVALDYWTVRFSERGIKHEQVETLAERHAMRFEDPEGQRLVLVDDGGAPFEGQPRDDIGIPEEFAIRGFYGVTLSVPRLEMIEPVLTRALYFSQTARHKLANNDIHYIYAMEGGGPGKEVHVLEQRSLPRAGLGYGGVHHVAFRVRDDNEQNQWNEWLTRVGVPTSGVIDRFYFKSLYFRISNGILFELATDGPGFATDEPLETLGERLALPPFLEPHRERIEAGLRPI